MDDDLAVGSVHLLETIEFLTRSVTSGGAMCSFSTSSPSGRIRAGGAIDIRTLRRLDAVIDAMDVDALRAARQRQDAMEAQEIVMSALMGNEDAQSDGVCSGNAGRGGPAEAGLWPPDPDLQMIHEAGLGIRVATCLRWTSSRCCISAS